MASVYGLRGRERPALEGDTTTEVLCRADIDLARSKLEKGKDLQGTGGGFPLGLRNIRESADGRGVHESAGKGIHALYRDHDLPRGVAGYF